jgi:uncharacterized protein (TIGR02145 family)
MEELTGGTYKTTGAYCWYNNDSVDYENGYGKLYNFGTVYSGKLCPVGWHVPRYFGIGIAGSPSEDCYNHSYLGGELMETGSNHWINPHSSCISNETGFTAIPGGKRNSDGTFIGLGSNAYLWTSGWAGHGPLVIYYMLPHSAFFGNSSMSCSVYPTDGLSVRCVKD